jgi:predicted kinase
MKTLTLLVGPAGSGKSTLAKELLHPECVYVNQDSQQKEHLTVFANALEAGFDIIVDRMNFNKQQRDRYLSPAKDKGYNTKIIVLHQNYETCMNRCLKRLGHHETINTKEDATNALNMFFSKYERPEEDEADSIEFRYPERALKLNAIVIDIDGTAANIDHRLNHVRGEGKKHWGRFFEEAPNDTPNEWCRSIVKAMRSTNIIVYCSGRPDNFRITTTDWLTKHGFPMDQLFMRQEKDSREDSIVKEILLDFEILTRYSPLFVVDDRPRVCRMWRKRGLTVLQCNDVEF